MLTEKVLYISRVKATTGRDNQVVSSDGILDLKVTLTRAGWAARTAAGLIQSSCLRPATQPAFWDGKVKQSAIPDDAIERGAAQKSANEARE